MRVFSWMIMALLLASCGGEDSNKTQADGLSSQQV